MAAAQRFAKQFWPTNLATDEIGVYVDVPHNLGRQFLCVEVWRAPLNKRDTQSMVFARDENTIRVYLAGGISGGTSVIVRVVG